MPLMPNANSVYDVVFTSSRGQHSDARTFVNHLRSQYLSIKHQCSDSKVMSTGLSWAVEKVELVVEYSNGSYEQILSIYSVLVLSAHCRCSYAVERQNVDVSS